MKDKKSMIMVILIGITICLFLVFNTTVFATTGTVTASDLRLREQNSTSSNIIQLLDENQQVEILSEDGDWYKVKVNNKVGYVNKQFVKVKENTNIVNNDTTSTENNNSEAKNEVTENKQEEDQKEENSNTDTNQEAKKYQEAIVKEDSSIRVMPLINGDIISTAKTNQKVIVVSNTGIWSYVKGESINGWILSKSINIQDTTVNIQEETSSKENKENNEQENKQEETQVEKTENKEENKTENKENEENKTTQESQNNNTEKKEEVEQNPETTYSSKKTYYVSATSVNVRNQASKSAQVIKVLNTNNEVTVTGESGEWYIVTINGKKGYIAKTLLSTTKKEVTSRSTTSVQEQKKETTQQKAQTNNQQTQAQTQKQTTQTTPATQTQTQQSSTSSSSGAAVAAYARQFVGYPYVYGASGPNAFDCSGFAQYVYKHFGYSLNRVASAQASNGVAVSKSNLQAGDLVFFNTSGGISHVGIYIGGGQFVHASTSKTGVIISSLSSSYYQQRYVTARRIVK